MIQPYDVVVVTNGQTDSIWMPNGGYWLLPINDTLYDLGDLHCSGEYPTPMYYTGNDALTLMKNEYDIVDIFAKTGNDPGSNGWNDIPPTYFAGDEWWTSWTRDQTLIRKPSVMNGVTANPDIFMVNIEWDSLPNNTFENLGFHDCDCHVTDIDKKPANIEVSLFPNPVTNGEINIESGEIITAIELLNALGQTIRRVNLLPDTKNHTLKLMGMDNGIYFVKITFVNTNILVKKIIVQ